MRKSQQPQTTQMSTFCGGGGINTLKCVVIALATLLAVSGTLLFTDLNHDKAVAESNSSNATSAEIAVSLKSTGSSDGTTTTLDRKVYHSGDEVIVTWKGATSGNDFIIPTSIRVDGVERVSISELNKVDAVQTANKQYERRMGSAGTMTTYESLAEYLTTEHAVSLGVSTVDTNVEVQYERVSPVYRMYNMITSEHLFSTNKTEYDGWVEKCELDQDFWIGEGIDWLAPTSTENTKTVHRLYNEALGAMGSSSHYYTADEAEMASLTTPELGWVDDGEANWFMSGGTTPIYTCYNEGLGSAHHYTSSKSEWESLEQHGWALEKDKNGVDPAVSPEGVFQCTMATNWSFSPNYYTVEHKLQTTDNTYSLAESQVVAGNADELTNAVAKSYPGYEPSSITQKTIIGNSTVVQVNYDRKPFTVTFDGNGVTLTGQTSKTVKYGDKVTAVSTPNSGDNREFKNWYYDKGCTKPFSFEYETMPAGNLTLYAGWTGNNSGGDDTSNNVTVTFYLQGLGDNVTKQIERGSKIDRIIDPTYAGYTFDGWYTDLTFATEFNFENPITTSTIIYAKWTPTGDGSAEIFYVTFDYRGKGGNNLTLPVLSGTKVQALADPTHAGYRFDGWFKDTSFDSSSKYDFSTPVTGSFTLYAKWVETQTEPVVEDITVIFNYMEKGTNSTQTIKKGAKVAEPATPSATGYKFGGWYTDTSFAEAKKFDFNTVLYDHMTLYAYWIADNRGITGNDGQTTIKHPISGDVMSVKVTYDHDGIESTPEEALPSAVVEVNSLGSVRVTAPDVVAGRDVTVEIKDSFGLPVTNMNVALNEASGKSRGYGATDAKGIVKFPGDNKKETGEDGKAEPVKPGTGEVIDTTVTYDHDNDTSTPEVPLPDAKVEITEDGSINVTVPEDAKGKDVTVNAKDEAGNPLPNKDVTIADVEGDKKTEREPGKTDSSGNAKFEGDNKGITNSSGEAKVVDPTDGKVKTITVTYDKDGDRGKATVEVVLPGAKVEIDGNGKVKATVPSEAQGKDVTVNVKDDAGKAVPNKDANVKDASGSDRGDAKTDTNGDAKFPASTGKTDEGGKVNPLDPEKKEIVTTTVTYDDDNDTSTPEVPLEGATVVVADDGKITVSVPAIADNKDVTVNVKDKIGAPVSGKSVELKKSDGTSRGTGTTDAEGNAKFEGDNKGTTGTTGTDTVLDPSTDKTLTITVTYDADGNSSTAEVVLADAKIEINGKGKVHVDLPQAASGRDVTVNVKDGTVAVVGRSVSVTDIYGSDRADKITDSNGDAKFPASSGKTDGSGEAKPLDPTKKEVVVTTVTYDHDNNSLTPQIPLEGAGVEVATDGSVAVTLPDAAIGKDVTVNVSDNNGKPQVGVNVSAIDSDGESRGTVATDEKGNAKFEGKNKNKTGDGGSTEIIDPSTGNKLKVTVTVDSDGDASNGNEPLPEASVEIGEDGIVNVRIPEVASGMDAWVNVSDMAGKGVANKTVTMTEFDCNKRADGITDANGDVAFPSNKGKTDEKGNTTPVKPGGDDKTDVVDTTVTYDDDSDSSTPEVPLPGAEVEVDKDGNIKVKLPAEADGKDVTVNAKDKGGSPLADKNVNVTDANGTERTPGKTDAQGNAKFPGDNKGTTGADGKENVTDPTTGNTVAATVTYDKNGDGEIADDEVCLGATIEAKGDGKVYVKVPAEAAGKDVNVNLKDGSGNPIQNKPVIVNDDNGSKRGEVNTDTNGDARFSANKGETDKDGQTKPVDPSKKQEIDVTVTYDDDNDTSTEEVPLPGAIVEVDDAGKVTITLPEEAKNKDVTATIKNKEGYPIEGKDVVINELGGTKRVEGKTDNNGQIKAQGKNKGTIDGDGGTTTIDPSVAYVRTKVTYDHDGDNGAVTAEITAIGSKVEIDGQGVVRVTLPEDGSADGKNVTVTVTNTLNRALVGKSVTLTESAKADKNYRGLQLTNATGVAVFKVNVGTTDSDGRVAPVNPNTKEKMNILLKYGEDETTAIPLPGAVVEIDNNSKINVTIPAIAQGKNVYVNVRDNKINRDPIANVNVGGTDVNGNVRADATTDNNGNATLAAKRFAVTFDPQNGADTWTVYVNEGDAVPEPATPTHGKITDTQFQGWYEAKSATADTGYAAWDFNNVVTQDMTLYAEWPLYYWIGPSSKITPATSNSAATVNADYLGERINVTKYRSEIQEDVKILKDTSHATYSADEWTRVYNEYKSYCDQDDFHLYVKNTNAGNRNDYVEFRIIEVGNHNDGWHNDGTALTFQAIHTLSVSHSRVGPSAPYSSQNWGGFSNTELHRKMQTGGSIYKEFDPGLTNDITTVQRVMQSQGRGLSSLAHYSCRFWILSRYEFTGQNRYLCRGGMWRWEYDGHNRGQLGTAFDGNQYYYWSKKSLNNDVRGSNASLAFRSRIGATVGNGIPTRSAEVVNPWVEDGSWADFLNNGCTCSETVNPGGIVVAFCF